MNRKYILVAMVLGASVLSSCTKEKEDNFEYKEVSASQVVSDLGISSSVVTFSITAGNGTAPTDVVALTGSEIDLPAANSFSLDGCDFDGWSTSFNGTPLEKDKDGKQKLKVEGNTVLYATWKARTVRKALDAKVPEDGKLVIEEKNLTEWEFKQLKGLVEAGYTEIDLSKTEITEIPKGTFNFSEYNWAIPGDGHYYYMDPKEDEKLNFDGLKKITLPEKLKKIGEGAFTKCILLEEINFSKTALEEIGDRAFDDCPSLKTLTLNEKVKTIGEEAFDGCPLTNVTNEDPEGEKAFVIPNSVTSIGDDAFYGAEFTKIEVGEGLKLVRRRTFANCSNLTEITFNYNGIDKLRINPDAFAYCEKLTKILYKAKEGVDLPDANKYSIGVDVEKLQKLSN